MRYELEGECEACVGHVKLLKHRLAESGRSADCHPFGAKLLLAPGFLHYYAIRRSKSGDTARIEERELTLGAGIQCG